MRLDVVNNLHLVSQSSVETIVLSGTSALSESNSLEARSGRHEHDFIELGKEFPASVHSYRFQASLRNSSATFWSCGTFSTQGGEFCKHISVGFVL